MDRHEDNLTTADLADPAREGNTRDTVDERETAEAVRERDPAAVDKDDQQRDAKADAAGEEVGDRDLERVASSPQDAQEREEQTPLLPTEQATEFRVRWEELQTSFVDEPRRSVEDGDALVADLMQRLAQSFSDERRALEAQWDRGDDVSTEDLRIALQRYRSFFDRLLSA
jgi:hypothetical protein